MDTNETLNLILEQISDMNKKFDKIDERFDSIDEKFNKIDLELATINRKLDGVIEQTAELVEFRTQTTKTLNELKTEREITSDIEIAEQILKNIKNKRK